MGVPMVRLFFTFAALWVVHSFGGRSSLLVFVITPSNFSCFWIMRARVIVAGYSIPWM